MLSTSTFNLPPVAAWAAAIVAALLTGCGASPDSRPDGSRDAAMSTADSPPVPSFDIGAPPALPDADGVDADSPALDTSANDTAVDSAEPPATDDRDAPAGLVYEVATISVDSNAFASPDADNVDVDQLDNSGPIATDADNFDLGFADVHYAPNALAVPVVNGTTYTFTVGDQVLAVDAAKGARIVTFSLAGRNILTAAKDAQDNNWGSTFWPSPQSAWNWPPPAEIDPNAFSVSKTLTPLTFSGATATTLGLSASKTFSVDSTNGGVAIDYTLINHATKARSVAPWEITRVAAGGLTFFPMGDGSPSKGSQDLLDLQLLDGVAWFAYDARTITSDQKVYADAHEGWIAHVAGNLLMVKVFSDIAATQAAPGEAEIEIFTDAAHTYIEVEDQGAYLALAPGATRSWTVRWFLLQLDPAISVGVGSPELLSTVRALVNSS